MPVLVVGTKVDCLRGAQRNADYLHKRASSMAEELGADEILLVRQRMTVVRYQLSEINFLFFCALHK